MQSVGVKGTRIDLFATIEAAVDIEESDRWILSRGAVWCKPSAQELIRLLDSLSQEVTSDGSG